MAYGWVSIYNGGNLWYCLSIYLEPFPKTAQLMRPDCRQKGAGHTQLARHFPCHACTAVAHGSSQARALLVRDGVARA